LPVVNVQLEKAGVRLATVLKGRGALLEAAKTDLLPAWESGSSGHVAEAMATVPYTE
jgi:hypothetical protein